VNNSVSHIGGSFAVIPRPQTELPAENCRGWAKVRLGNKTGTEPVWTGNGQESRSKALEEQDKLARFEQRIMPHMNAAYNLARWLAGNDSDAQDVVQEAYLRAFKFLSGFRGGDSRSWLLRIVRNAFYDWLKRNRREETGTPFEDEVEHAADASATPDALLLEKADHELLHKTIAELPLEFREILVLRELEGFSYKEISEIAGVPLGTVMSRLARAREHLRTQLAGRLQREIK
jgi:RNA polymerase sigma-70 factor (ECF subfamily)